MGYSISTITFKIFMYMITQKTLTEKDLEILIILNQRGEWYYIAGSKLYKYIFLKIPILEDQQWPESKNFPDNYSTKVVAILEKGTIVYLLNSTFGLLCGSV